jgi:ubiquitin-protein ligase
MEQDPHVRRLLVEQEKLINLSSRSDFIRIDPVEVTPGMPPDKYVITFTCRGIERINDAGEPVASDFHQVSMYISREFPRQEPHLKWLTPIWHPNIEHEEPHHVCTNNVQNFYSTKGLDDLVVILGEMVQYKHYHAVWKEPWPYDKKVADWVVGYAEPRGIVKQDKPFDSRPLLRKYKIRSGGGEGAKQKPKPQSPAEKATARPTKRDGLVLGSRRGQTGQSPSAAPVRKPGVTLRSKCGS